MDELNSTATFVEHLSTGYVVIDAIICLLVPVVVQQMITILQGSSDSLFTKLYNWLFNRVDENLIVRTIEITQKFNEYGNKIWDYEQKNHLLQKAISIYLADIIDLENKDAKYDLLEKPKNKKKKTLEKDSDLDDKSTASESTYDSDSDNEEDEDTPYYGSVDKLNVEAMPSLNEWIMIEDGVYFMHEMVTPQDGGGNDGKKVTVTETKVVFKFRSSLPDGSDRIDAIINKAFTKYQIAERKKYIQDKARYFYIQAGTKATGNDSESSTVAYKRYALGEEKTFENLFFKEKAQILQLLDNFTNRAGKFAIKGFPYKLGLLLHGPPGTGKTSLIKAVAQYTKRHIVTISLGKIKTNQELLDALFDMKFAVQGMDTPIEMSFEDVVFVMEDIDCASSIVNARDSNDDTDKKSKDPRTERMLKSQKKAAEEDDGMPGLIGPLMKPKNNDKLNLSGLLNVLDGVIDCPGRIVIMTTNHPEKLDPALIRPGRVNKKLLLTYMGCTEVQQMIEYFCTTTFTEKETHELQNLFENATKRITPAEVEELCAEYDDVESIFKGLRALLMNDEGDVEPACAG